MALGDVFLAYDGDKFRVYQIKGREREAVELSADESLERSIQDAYNAMYEAPGRELRLGLTINRWTVAK